MAPKNQANITRWTRVMPQKKDDNWHGTIVEAAGKQRWKIKCDGFVTLEEIISR